MLTLFAHAGEVHEPEPALISNWYIWLPLWLLAVVILVGGIYLLTKRNQHAAFGMLLAILLITGFGAYQKSPLLSTASLSIGFGLSLAQLVGLGKK